MNIISSIFWVVTKPTPASTFEDIFFKSNWKGMELQFLGGLRFDQIHGIYTDESEAIREAGYLLNEQEGR